MKPFILQITFFIISLCFNFTKSSEQIHNQDVQIVRVSSQLGDCSVEQKNAVLSVINYCEVSDLDTTTECISDQITRVYASQQWNVFAKNTAQNKDTVLYWRYNNCFLNLVNIGKFNRTYILWPVKTYLNETHSKDQSSHNKLIRSRFITRFNESTSTNSLRAFQSQPNVDCPSWKKATVNKIIKSCSIDGNDAAAGCIFDKVREQLGEYWDVCIQTSIFGTSFDIFYFGGCSVNTDGSDSFRRYIYVWKAH